MSSKLFEKAAPASRKRHAPATLRNREPIREVLARVFGEPSLILEVASGTGEHAVYFAEHLPHLQWQPSDLDEDLLASIEAYREEAALPNVRPPLRLDASSDAWPIDHADGILSCNMIHIAPIAAAEGLIRGAARILKKGGALVLYGPFREGGRHTAESNERFDADLRARNPEWGVRDLDEIAAKALEHGLVHEETVRMPANNLTVVFRKQ